MARFFDDTSFNTNYPEDYFITNTTIAEKPGPAEKIPTKREQNQDNLRRIQEETRKRTQKKLR